MADWCITLTLTEREVLAALLLIILIDKIGRGRTCALVHWVHLVALPSGGVYQHKEIYWKTTKEPENLSQHHSLPSLLFLCLNTPG